MRRELLRRGDVVEVDMPFCRHTFEARVEGFEDMHVLISPIQKWATWRRVPLANIKARLQPPPRKHRKAAAA